jgi:retinol-binding protein 3
VRTYIGIFAVLLFPCLAHAKPVAAPERIKVIDTVVDDLRTSYVDADQASKLETVLRHTDFSQAVSDETFATAVTTVMQDVTKDLHLRLLYSAKELPEQKNGSPTSAEIAERKASLRAQNYGLECIERLPGNIGYLKTTFFAPAAEAAPSIAAAMTLLSNTDALIIDLRENGGGAADAVPLIASYLFDERTHLSDFYRREGNVTDQQWTYPAVAGNRFGVEKEVYVLTSKHTFSAAEGLAFTLKNLKRAKTIGERTRGGAHPSRVKQIDAHYALMVPTSTVRDSVTGKDWEGIGVLPDIPVSAEEALTKAQVIILNKMLTNALKAESQVEIRKRLAELTSKR